MKDEIIYGLNPVMEALRGTRRAFELFVAGAGSDRRFAKMLQLAKERDVPVRQRAKGDISRLCGTEHHQGVALRVEAFAYADVADILESWRGTGESGLLVVLDGVQDPHNLGALIRSQGDRWRVHPSPGGDPTRSRRRPDPESVRARLSVG